MWRARCRIAIGGQTASAASSDSGRPWANARARATVRLFDPDTEPNRDDSGRLVDIGPVVGRLITRRVAVFLAYSGPLVKQQPPGDSANTHA